LLALDGEAIDRAVDEARRLFSAQCLEAEPEQIFVTCHADGAGRPSVLFVINPSETALCAKVAACGAQQAVDSLTLTPVFARAGRFALDVPARSVRMLELSGFSGVTAPDANRNQS
jgi:hypothetical protein